MNMHRLSLSVAICACLLQLFSCQKQFEQNPNDSLEFQTSSDAAVVSEISDCKLRTVTSEILNAPGTPNTQMVGTFVYHPDGLPDQLTYVNGNSGNPNYYFVYDNKRRLREMRIGFSRTEPGQGGPWHRYGYNNLDQIIVDSAYNYNSGADPVGVLVRVSIFTYDTQGRITKEVKDWYDGASVYLTQTLIYNYDSRGNLIVEGWPSSSYDGQKSIFRAHPLFQFIHRNYSKNNAAPQGRYNVKGFPLSNNPMNDAFFNADPGVAGTTGITRASYDCDGFNPINEFLHCKLRTITHEFINPPGIPNVQVTGTFVYHPDGLPDQLTYTRGAPGNPDYYFLYDNKRRLRELRIGSKTTPDDSGPWHRYGYNAYDQIVADTLFNFSTPDPSSGTPRVISALTYDGPGRIIKEVETWYNGGSVDYVRTINYNYDTRGNLIVAGWPSASYDNKVSIFRAHTVFQFIHRNYSKNNAAPQPRYNSKGLPFSNNPANDAFFNAYPNDSGSTPITKANYDCP